MSNQKFSQLSMVQKAMVLAYKNGHSIPFIEEHHRAQIEKKKKDALQKAFSQAHKTLIGDENARRRYWI